MNSTDTPTRLTPAGMLAAVESCHRLAWQLAYRFHAKNPAIRLTDLHDVAAWALKVAAVKFDPSRGLKFVTPAYRYVWLALIDFCRVESARGMHVPQSHPPYYAPRPLPIRETWQTPQGACGPRVNELGEEFWQSVARDLTSRERELVLAVFRDGLSRTAARKRMGITKQRAGQLFAAAMVRLRGREDLKELARAA
jgi:DNA-directed RNA polymerase specialized sigma subunit